VDLDARRGIDPPSVEGLSVDGQGLLLAVCDGVGGRRAGEVASSLALECLPQEMNALGPVCPETDLFRRAVENVSRRVWQESKLDPVLEGMTTTLTAAVICQNRAVVAHVGDSRAYVLRDGQMRQITRDHSFVAQMVESGALTLEEARRSPYRNVILQAVGQKKALQVALDAVDLCPGDVLLLCTDGLSEKVSAAEMARVVQSGEPRQAAEALVKLANDRGGEDNITVLIGKVEGGEP
jgi:serine/threonine protein phosphatase PrpC